MKKVAASIVFLLAVISVVTAFDERPLLEVRVSSSGMVSFVGEYLHLRVLDDGRVEYQEAEGEGRRYFTLRKTQLSPSELSLLRQFLDGSQVKALATEYPSATPTIDHLTLITISIHRGDGDQSIKIRNYDMALGKDKGLYSQGLINLVCRIDQVGGAESSRLTARGWCTLWSKP